jgi:hypothetical protein
MFTVAVGFEADRARRRQLKRFLQNFTVAGAISHIVLHGHLDHIPILRPVFFQVFVWAGHQIISHLQLRFPEEQTTVSVHGSPELQQQVKVLRKSTLGPHLPQPWPPGRIMRMHDDHPVLCRVTPVGGLRLAVETIGHITPAGEILAVEQTLITRLYLEIDCLRRRGKTE